MSVKTLVVWDYDWSLIDTNSDVYIIKELCPELMVRFSDPSNEGMGWTAIMDHQMHGLFDAGIGKDAIVECIAGVPLGAGHMNTIEKCGKSANIQQVVLSDANTVFIEEFMQKQGIRHYFSEIRTNFAEFDADGRLRVRPYHQEAEPHRCPLCPMNLCKGRVLAELRETYTPERVIYVGDGGGDFCPCCDLVENDAVLCRAAPSPPLTSFSLWNRIQNCSQPDGHCLSTRHEVPAEIKASVHAWHTSAELETIFSTLLGPT